MRIKLDHQRIWFTSDYHFCHVAMSHVELVDTLGDGAPACGFAQAWLVYVWQCVVDDVERVFGEAEVRACAEVVVGSGDEDIVSGVLFDEPCTEVTHMAVGRR